MTRGVWIAATLLTLLTTCSFASGAAASPAVRYGVEDDAWLMHGPGTLESRLAVLDDLEVDIVRFTLRWDEIARARPSNPRQPSDPAYRWGREDAVLKGLRRHGIAAVLTIVGAPSWANGGKPANWAPTRSSAFADFAYAAATRYSWVRDWTIWNEPNLRSWLRPTSAAVYVSRLLNPAYDAIHAAIPDARVAGGMTSPRGGTGGVSPVAWIREMGAAKARLDAYAHHPYPSRPQVDTPWGPACSRCSTITMAELGRLVAEVRRAFGAKRIWLTEYGYQTNPPDTLLGVPPATQARYVASADRRAYATAGVDMLIYYLVQDDGDPAGWQSGFLTSEGLEKPSYSAFRLPFTEVRRDGDRVTVWGQVRAGAGARPYRLRTLVAGRWAWLGGTRSTDRLGFFTDVLRLDRGAVVQLWSPGSRAYSLELRLT